MHKLLILVAALLLSSCTQASPSPTPTAIPTPPTPAEFKVSQISGAQPLSSGIALPDIVDGALPSIVQIAAGFSTGTGFIVSSGGLIVTNEHVVSGVDSAQIQWSTGQRLSATVTRRNATLDIAHLQLDAANVPFKPIAVGNSDTIRVGESVVVIGFPASDSLGSEPTVSQGILSAKRNGLLQTDAPINPGNSGGPLLNGFGEVVGVVVSRLEQSGGRDIQGVGFAVPVNDVQGVHVAPTPTPGPTATPTPIPSPTPTFTPTATPTPEPTPTPTATATPHPSVHCPEWEALVLEWIKQGNNFGHWEARTPDHPQLSAVLGSSICITAFPQGRLYSWTTVGDGEGQLLPGLYEFRQRAGEDKRVNRRDCYLEVAGSPRVEMPYGEPFQFTFHTYHGEVYFSCPNAGYLGRVGA